MRQELVWMAIVFCIVGLSDALGGCDQAAEEILRNACPTKGELLSGIEYVNTHDENYKIEVQKCDERSYLAYIVCSGGGMKYIQCPEGISKCLGDQHDFGVWLFAWDPCNGPYSSEDVYSEELEDLIDKQYTIYDGLPAGVIKEETRVENDEIQMSCEIKFWKTPGYTGGVSVYAHVFNEDKYGCTPSYEERVAEAKARVRPDCERLAKLAYDRLPGGDEAMLRAQGDIETAKAIRDNVKPSKEEEAAYLCRLAGISCPGLDANQGLLDVEGPDPFPNKERDYTHWSHVVEQMEEAFRYEHYEEVHTIFVKGYEEYAEYY